MAGKHTVFEIEERQPGKGLSGKFRKERKVPAVVYGPKMENHNCLIDEIFVLKHSGSRYESAIFQTKSDSKPLNSLKVMLKKIDVHPVSKDPIHVDLYALDMTAKIKVNVNIEFEGEPAVVTDGEAILSVIMRDIEIECNPTDIPDFIKVDVSGLELNDSVHVSDITFPEGIVPITAEERTVCNVMIPKEEPAEPAEEDEMAAAAEGEEGAEGADAAAEGEATEGDKKEEGAES